MPILDALAPVFVLVAVHCMLFEKIAVCPPPRSSYI